MLKHRTWILAILSFSFSSSLAALAKGQAVKIPVEVLYRHPVAPAPLSGELFLADKVENKTAGRAVLFVQKAGENQDVLEERLRDSGFHVLKLTLRESTKKNPKILLEDVQSGVVFLKTDARVHAIRVLLIGAGNAADGLSLYAGANKQMARIVDAMALIQPSNAQNLQHVQGIPTLLLHSQKDPLPKNVNAACQGRCRTMTYKSKLFEADFNKTVVDFLLNPTGPHG